jgi:hypothetical protein
MLTWIVSGLKGREIERNLLGVKSYQFLDIIERKVLGKCFSSSWCLYRDVCLNVECLLHCGREPSVH